MKYLQSKDDAQKLQNLRHQFHKVGSNFSLGKDYSFNNPQNMEFGENFHASHRCRIETINEFQNQKFTPKIKIGNNVIFNTDIHIGCIDSIEIGDNCLFASRIFISDHDHGDISASSFQLPPIKRTLHSKGPIVIKNNVWVGEGVAILGGITIGENAVIATNAVVTKDVPANTVVGGIPARIIKKIEI